MAESSVSAHNDDKKFLLLPEDGNHDVAIFDTGTNAAANAGREGGREGGLAFMHRNRLHVIQIYI